MRRPEQECGGYECRMPCTYGNGLILPRLANISKQQRKPRQSGRAYVDKGAASWSEAGNGGNRDAAATGRVCLAPTATAEYYHTLPRLSKWVGASVRADTLVCPYRMGRRRERGMRRLPPGTRRVRAVIPSR